MSEDMLDTEMTSQEQTNYVLNVRMSIMRLYKRNYIYIWRVLFVIFLLAYGGYFAYAMYFRFGDSGSKTLLGVTVFAFTLVSVTQVYKSHLEDITSWLSRRRENIGSDRLSAIIRWSLRVGVFLVVTVYVTIDIAVTQPRNLVSLAGMLMYMLIFYVTSVNPARINWHTVYWGISVQFIFALLILRTQWGYAMFSWFGDRISDFLSHVLAGIVFVFGDAWSQHVFVMKILAIAPFFMAFINILYYLGVMQAIIGVIGRFLAFCMGTTPAESINAAANIFCSMTESPVMIQPFLNSMTRSELHAVMTGGFATVAGGVLAAYISFGVPANHLLSASVMSAPAALAISKISYPETEKTKATKNDFVFTEKRSEHNILEAVTNGATFSIKICGAVATNVIAFLSLLAFVNATLTWFGQRVGIENLTFEYICSYVLYPVAFFMGVEPSDCGKVAELVGIKTFTNEFIAYSNLKILLKNKKDLNNYTSFYNTSDWSWADNDIVLNITNKVLIGGIISKKSEVIATYALCGFANFGSIGITLGTLGALAPSRSRDLANMALRAMICGNVACFMTACIAGLLYKPF